MSLLKEIFVMFLIASAALAALIVLTALAFLAVKFSMLNLPYWLWFVTFPCIGGAYIVGLALSMCALDSIRL